MSKYAPPLTPRIDPHTWAKGTPDAIDGAAIHLGARHFFIAQTEIPAAIARLQTILDVDLTRK